MANLRKRAMDAVLEAAGHDIAETLKEQDIDDIHSEDADEAVFDVAILYAYRVFIRICEQQGVEVNAAHFADLADELVEEIAEDPDAG